MSAAPADGDRVLVTGGAGFIGRHLVARLLAAGRAVTVLDDLSTGSLANLPAHPSLSFMQASVLDAAATREAARGAAEVYHLASVVGMRRATQQREHAHRVAVEGTRHVLGASGAARAVLFSSSAVYGLRHADPASEAHALHERDTREYDGGGAGYATGKLGLETLGADAARAGREVLVVRPFNVVGRGQSPAYGMVLPTFVQRALAGEELIVHDDGRQARAFSHVDTFLDALFRLQGVPAAWRAPGNVFNVGTPEATTILQLADLVQELTGSARPPRFIPYAEAFPGRRDVPSRAPDPARLHAAIGALAWPSVRDIVREVVREARETASGRP
jgi:UDP-glucose 4-epimerase